MNEQMLVDILSKHLSDKDLLANLNAFTRRMHFIKSIAHYELFKQVMNLPGHIVECGVYKGASLLTFAHLLESFCCGDRTKKVYGFDHFKGLIQHEEVDGLNERVGNIAGGWNPEEFKSDLFNIIDIFNNDSFVPHKPRIELIDGDICHTAPDFVEKYPGLRISLLHLDVDLYQPTMAALKAFYPHIVKGGIVVLDEYGMTEWPGESKALEDYFGEQMPTIRKFEWCSAPGGYFIKP